MNQFKRAQVIMLPHNNINTTITKYLPNTLSLNNDLLQPHTNQHLYIISDDEIKEGDWVLYKNNPCLVSLNAYSDEMKVTLTYAIKYCKKIIATTDKSLITGRKIMPDGSIFDANSDWDIKYGVKSGFGLQRIQIDETLPQPSQDFLKVFIEEYNKGNVISDVSILLNEPCCKCDTSEKLLNCCYNAGDIEGTCNAPNPNKDFYGLYPKVNPDNTINISIPGMDLKRLIRNNPVIEKEIFDLCEKAYNDGILSNCGETFLDWFQDNVK